MSDKRIIVIIPARGGSKRFPGKNVHPLLGEPLISHVIKPALASEKVDRVIVSTDDDEIANVAKSYGAEVPFFRPDDLSGDNSPVIEALAYTVKRLDGEGSYHADHIMLLQPTTPLITREQIDGAIDLVLSKNADSVVSVVPVDTPAHPYNVRQVDQDGRMKFWQEELHYKDLGKKKPAFYKAANIWLTSYNTLLDEHKIEGANNYALVVDTVSALDIDYKEDLELVEAWLQYQKNKKT